jgi:glutathione peroxidase
MTPTAKLIRCLTGLGLLMATSLVSAAAPAAACPSSLNHTLLRLQDEKPQSLCQYAGKVVLAVNTASYCGFTKGGFKYEVQQR